MIDEIIWLSTAFKKYSVILLNVNTNENVNIKKVFVMQNEWEMNPRFCMMYGISATASMSDSQLLDDVKFFPGLIRIYQLQNVWVVDPEKKRSQ